LNFPIPPEEISKTNPNHPKIGTSIFSLQMINTHDLLDFEKGKNASRNGNGIW
jgi:hypothetical protein